MGMKGTKKMTGPQFLALSEWAQEPDHRKYIESGLVTKNDIVKRATRDLGFLVSESRLTEVIKFNKIAWKPTRRNHPGGVGNSPLGRSFAINELIGKVEGLQATIASLQEQFTKGLAEMKEGIAAASLHHTSPNGSGKPEPTKYGGKRS